MKTKNLGVQVKAVGADDGLEDGQFEALVSVFNNIDTYGDVVMPGAFKADLERWEKSGDPIPVIFSHDWGNLRSHVGSVIKAEERPEGLWIRGQIEDRDINPDAELLYRKLKGRRIKQFSFAYDVEDAGYGKHDGRDVYELRQLKVHEVGPCLLGVNQETELLAVKARALVDSVKAGSQLDMTAVREARDTLSALLDAAKADEPETDKTSGAPAPDQTDEPSQVDERTANDEEPGTAKSEEPPVKSAPRRAQAVALITNLS